MNKENLANALVVSASGTTIELETGHGSRLPATPFFATAAPMGEVPSKDNSEIVQVTNVSGDTLTVVRAQRGTSAKGISTGWVIGNGVYIEDMKPIPVTVATAAATAAKVGSTAEANYKPTAGDVIEVTFTNGSNVSTPTLNIDGSGAKNIRLGQTNASTATMSLGTGAGSNVKIRMWYDGTYWQLYGANDNTNTTYSEITTAEITAGTASTARTISGRRAQEIVNKAQTGVVKSTTTGNLTASATAPASPTTGDVWIDTNSLPEELAPTSIVWKETPGGAANGINTSFTTASPYVGGSLQVFVNGLAQDGFVSETGPTSGTFSLDVAPLTGDNLSVQYVVRTTALGNANSVGGYQANPVPTASSIPVLDANGKMTAPMPSDSYSLTEVDTGAKWIDGKAIYKRTFIGTVSAAAATRAGIVLLAPALVDTLIDSSGYVTDPSGVQLQLGHQWFDGSGNKYVMSYISKLSLFVWCVSALTNAPYAVTAFYTKT